MTPRVRSRAGAERVLREVRPAAAKVAQHRNSPLALARAAPVRIHIGRAAELARQWLGVAQQFESSLSEISPARRQSLGHHLADDFHRIERWWNVLPAAAEVSAALERWRALLKEDRGK